jgi:rare lipoprotein A
MRLGILDVMASPPENVMPFINGRFYMNPAFGRSIERSRAADAHRPEPRAQDQDRWVTIAGRHVLIQTSEHGPSTTRRVHAQHSAATHPKPLKSTTLPSSGVASIYSDAFDRKKTANGKIFDQNGYTAALLPRSRWHAVRLGTRVELTHGDNRVVVEIDDRGAGDKNPSSTRALDLSRAAASALTGTGIGNDDDAKEVGLIRLDRIKVVSADTPLGSVKR